MRAATLLVDDYPTFAESIRSAASDRGYAVDIATDYEECIAKFLVGGHELVVADYNLVEGTSGLKLLIELKQSKPGTRLVLISGALSDLALSAVDETGLVDAVFPKDHELVSRLMDEIMEAQSRHNDQTNWIRSAKAHLNESTISEDELDRIDQILRTDLANPATGN
jgi:ActR/RegA family two-component response regulator